MTRRNRRPTWLRESATAVLETPAPAQVALHETPARIHSEASGVPTQQIIQLIDAGWGSSGYYSTDVLAEAARQRIFPKGTHLYIDHPTREESEGRPERSLRDLAAVMTEDARYDPQRRGLVAQVRVFGPYQGFLSESHDAIGLSIRAEGIAEQGEAEGRQGMIVSSLTRGLSVDYVTHAGRGGRVLALLETARHSLTEARTMGAWLESRLHLALTQLADDAYGDGRLTRAERITLSNAIGDGLTAWTARVEADAPQLFTRDRWSDPADAQTDVVEAELTEATAEDTRRALSAAIVAAHVSGHGSYAYVCDYDPDAGLVWYGQRASGGEEHTWQENYTVNGGVVALVGTRVQVVARTRYEPVPPDGETRIPTGDATEAVAESAPEGAPTNVPDGTPPTAPALPTIEGSESVSTPLNTGPAPGAAGTDTATTSAAETVTAPNVQAAESAPTAPTTTAVDPVILERLAAVEAALTAERARGDQALAEAARLRAEGAARDTSARLLAEANIGAEVRDLIGARVTERVLLSVPMTEAGQVDQAVLETRVSEAITAERAHAARLLEAQGVGTVRGLGDTGSADSPQARQKDRVAAFRRLGLSESAAATAAAGQIGGRA